MADNTQAQPAPMQTGGLVMAIVPQTFPEIQKIAVQIITAGVAPVALVKWPKDDADAAEIEAIGKRNVAAVATCIMAGAELGLPPMVSLRAFTVINGKPALYADGNVAVVRKAKDADGNRVAEYLKTGFTEVRDYICPVCDETFPEEDGAMLHLLLKHEEQYDKITKAGVEITFARTAPTDKSFAWCEAKRHDNGEIYIEQFSIEDAKRAGLWDEKPFKRAKVWRDKKLDWHDDVPNDAVWFRYPQRMMMWRAVGYCLRWLFADVLGGMADEYEAREIEGMVDITPAIQAPRKQILPEPPPDDQPPAGGKPGTILENGAVVASSAPLESAVSLEPGGVDQNNVDAATGQIKHPATGEPMIDNRTARNWDEYFQRLDDEMSGFETEGEFVAAWEDFGVDAAVRDDEDAAIRASRMFTSHRARIDGLARKSLEAAGQGVLFGDALPMPPEDDEPEPTRAQKIAGTP